MSINVAEIVLEGFDPYDTTGAWDTGWFGSSLLRKARNTVKKVARVARSVAKNPIVGELTKQAQISLASSGPLGSAAAGALGGMAAVVKGQNLEQIGWSALEGASPTGIRQAIQAAHRVRNGEPVLNAAVGALAASLEPEGAKVVGRVVELVKSGASIAHLGAARRSLPREEHRRAFDATVGTISRAARGGSVKMAARTVAARKQLRGLARPVNVKDPVTERAIRTASAGRTVSAPADRLLAVHPEWTALRADRLAAKLHVSQATAVGAARRRVKLLRPQKMSARAVRLLARLAPAVPIGLFRHGETAGFEQSNGAWIYVVEKGDYPIRLAERYAPGGKATAGKTYRQLLTANPNYPRNAAGDNFRNFWAGMRLKWPSGWTVPSAAEPAPAPTVAPAPTATPTPVSLPSPTVPEPTPVLPNAEDLLMAVVQAKALLAAWGVSDGVTESGPTDYGKRAEDLTATWGPRDKLMLTAFSRWSNSHRQTDLSTDGVLGPEHSRELARWAEDKAKAPALPATTAPTTVVVQTPSDVPQLPAATMPTSVTPVKIDLPPAVVTAPTATSGKTPATAASAGKKSSALPILLAAAAFAML